MAKRVKIVLASVLKPVDDTRMYEKFACSIAKMDQYEIFVIGFKSKRKVQHSKIRFLPIFYFQRISFKRMAAPWKFYKNLLKLKPEIVIVNTHELLVVSCLFKIIFGAEILYDVQENYFRNIWFSNTYPPLIKQAIALMVRCTEYLTRPCISHYFLAERNYEKEFSFTKGKSSVLENKYQPINILTHNEKWDDWVPMKEKHKTRLLYSGTIARNYGILEAIHLVKKISKTDESIELLIIGYCADRKLLNEVKENIKDSKQILLKGGNELVPHPAILKAIQTADFGLIAYQPEPSIENCIPTRIYEYMAHKLPMIVQENPIWVGLCKIYNAGIYLDYKKIDPQALSLALKTTKFYTKTPGEEILWHSEEQKLVKTISGVAKKVSNK